MSQSVQGASFGEAADRYAALGVDVEKAIGAALAVPISIHCWQGDDVGGFEREGAGLSDGGIQVTGRQPGKARSLPELRMDIEKVVTLCPGERRLSLHATYGEFGGKFVDRDAIEVGHFSGWMQWAGERHIPLDFNSTLFSHPLAAGGYTLSHRDQRVRAFWIEHVERTRRIAAAMGKSQGSASVLNLWIPDGAKDSPVDRKGYRERLAESLDAIYAERFPAHAIEDSVEGKLFGIGSEAFVVGSHDFYLAYAATRHLFLTLDMGHFHPTESVADKISAILPFVPGLLLHVSRGLRWDSDHVVTLGDELGELARELVRSGSLDRVRFGLDYFDASIDRIGAWALGFRSARKALLAAFLEPRAALLAADEAGNGFARLALLEEAKAMPWSAVWDECCRRSGVPEDRAFIGEVEAYARTVTSKRAAS